MFGTATLLQNGQRAPNGFAALKELDADRDGKITPRDPAWKTLRIWVDKNRNGVTDPGELYTLDQAGITYLNTTAISMMEVDSEGNQTRLRSTFHRWVTGQDIALLMVDIWFSTLIGY